MPIMDALKVARSALAAFNTPLEMPDEDVLKGGEYETQFFQYSIGDAGGSCRWFLWVFKFC